MKSVGYSTFYNESNDNDNNNYNYNDTEKQCIICLQGPEESSNNIIIDDVKLMNEMHFLIKECKCECYSHHNCIEQWIKNNSVCPICKGPISFPKSGIKEEIIQMPINEAHDQREIIILQTTKSSNIFCIRILFGLFALCVCITVFNNNN
jgi:hypothetical protein